jgi:exopolysaccharide biosynthesis polyprenyl glycosylphosphotransferase
LELKKVGVSQLNKTRGEGSSADWKPKLRREIGVIDFFVLLVVTIVNLRIRFPQIWIDDLTNYEIKNIGIATVIIFSWLVVLWFNGSRDTNILGFGADEYKRLINATLFSFTFIAFVSYIFKLEISRGFVLLIFPTGLISLFISRRILRKRLLKSRNEGRYVSRVLLLHSGEADPVEKRLLIAKHAGLNIVHKLKAQESQEFNHKQIVAEALANNCDQIMVGQSAIISASELRNLGWALEETSIDLVVAPAVTEIAGPRLKVSNVEGLPLLHLDQPVFSGSAKAAKRLLDLFLSTVGLILISPFLIVIAFIIKSHDRGTVLYSQKRVGQNNKEFNVYKFRTMYEGSHEKRDEVMAQTNKDLRLAKSPNDPRITKPGAFLRRWSIDEIPQIINVFKGEMSLVGPRPPLAVEVNMYEKSERRRLLVKPGLTGLWQVSGRSELDWEDAVRLDLYYVENWSLTLDILILIRTAAAVWRGEGAY